MNHNLLQSRRGCFAARGQRGLLRRKQSRERLAVPLCAQQRRVQLRRQLFGGSLGQYVRIQKLASGHGRENSSVLDIGDMVGAFFQIAGDVR